MKDTVIAVLFASLLSINQGLIYVPDSLPWADANEYCQRIYGTELATIATRDDRDEAIAAIQALEFPVDQAWIGLYANNKDRPVWRFEDGSDCPSSSVYKCVDFWAYRLNENTRFRPRCEGEKEGGKQCAYFDESQDAVDNDVECTENRPFFCNGDLASECAIEGSVVTNYALSNLEDNGWTRCYHEFYGTALRGTAVLQNACPTGPDSYIFVGASLVSDPNNVIVGAYGPGSILTTITTSSSAASKPTGYESDAKYDVWWYNRQDYSFGFSAHQQINLGSADWGGSDNHLRLSWHTHTWFAEGGFRAGDTIWLNSDVTHYKFIWIKNCEDGHIYDTVQQELSEDEAYLVIDGPGTWAEAEQKCLDTYGTHLATILDQQQQSDAMAILMAHEFDRAWIGLNDIGANGMYYICYYIHKSTHNVII